MAKSPDIFGKTLFGTANAPEAGGKLEERFIVPPFTLLDTTSETWQSRAAAWRFQFPNIPANADPVLVEVLLSWFCPIGGKISGSGQEWWAPIAEKLGIYLGAVPYGMHDMTLEFLDKQTLGGSFGCTPAELAKEMAGVVACLAPNRFACFVYPFERGSDGRVIDFTAIVREAAEQAGAGYLNEMIYAVQPKGAPEACRATAMHGTILVFCKGDPRMAANACNIGRHDGGI